jgi:hypothetical protein
MHLANLQRIQITITQITITIQITTIMVNIDGMFQKKREV